jgi:hypothetical protein
MNAPGYKGLIEAAPWVCSECGNCQESGGACAACGEDPLVDAREADVRELLREMDQRRKDRFEGRTLWIAIPFGIALPVVILASFPLIFDLVPAPPLLTGVGSMIGVTMVVWIGIRKLFKPKVRFGWLGDSHEEFK